MQLQASSDLDRTLILALTLRLHTTGPRPFFL